MDIKHVNYLFSRIETISLLHDLQDLEKSYNTLLDYATTPKINPELLYKLKKIMNSQINEIVVKIDSLQYTDFIDKSTQ